MGFEPHTQRNACACEVHVRFSTAHVSGFDAYHHLEKNMNLYDEIPVALSGRASVSPLPSSTPHMYPMYQINRESGEERKGGFEVEMRNVYSPHEKNEEETKLPVLKRSGLVNMPDYNSKVAARVLNLKQQVIPPGTVLSHLAEFAMLLGKHKMVSEANSPNYGRKSSIENRSSPVNKNENADPNFRAVKKQKSYQVENLMQESADTVSFLPPICSQTQPGAKNQSENSVGTFKKFPESKTRQNFSSFARTTLKEWLLNHVSNPYPDEDEKLHLSSVCNISFEQVSNWFVNARMRLLKKEVKRPSLVKESAHRPPSVFVLADDKRKKSLRNEDVADFSFEMTDAARNLTALSEIIAARTEN